MGIEMEGGWRRSGWRPRGGNGMVNTSSTSAGIKVNVNMTTSTHSISSPIDHVECQRQFSDILLFSDEMSRGCVCGQSQKFRKKSLSVTSLPGFLIRDE